MTNICAAILCAQLERVDTLIEKRERINHLYEQNFTKNTKITLRQHEKECQPVNWLFSIILGNEQDRDQLIKFLSENGIETRPFFIPIHSLPPYSEYSHLDLPITNLLSRTGLNLPTYTELSDDDVNFISNKVNEFF